jgi:ABC-type sugar transport system substrate-binding protein
MEKVNGDANITAITEANKAGVPRFVYVSTVENNLPAFVLHGSVAIYITHEDHAYHAIIYNTTVDILMARDEQRKLY